MNAFWSTMAGAAVTIWVIPLLPVIPPLVTVSVTPPPGLATATVAIQQAFDRSTANEVSRVAAALDLANAMHGSSTGAMVTGTIAPSPAPVLVPIL